MSKVKPWAWVVLAASFFSMFCNSAFFAAGVIHIALIDRYPLADISMIAWIGSIFSSMFALTVFVGSIVINVFNVRVCLMLSGTLTLVGFTLSAVVTDIRMLFLTYSIIAGSGQAMSFAGSMVVIGYYFKEKSSMASGIATSGCGLCTFVIPPLSQFFVEKYGLPGAFLLLGGIGFQSAVCGALMRPTKYETGRRRFECLCVCAKTKKDAMLDQNGDTDVESTTSSIDNKMFLFTSGSFWLLLMSSATFHMGLSTVYLFLPDYFKHLGSTSREAAYILSIAGITGIFSRVLLGFLAATVDTAVVLGGTFGVMGLITFAVKYMTSIASKIMYTALFGFYTGGCWALQYTLLLDIVGLANISTGYGIMMFFSGMGYLLGPPFAEMMVVWFKDYYMAFVFAASSFLITSITALAIRATARNELTVEEKEIELGEKDSLLLEPQDKLRVVLKESELEKLSLHLEACEDV